LLGSAEPVFRRHHGRKGGGVLFHWRGESYSGARIETKKNYAALTEGTIEGGP